MGGMGGEGGASCGMGTADCNGMPGDGCEAILDTDALNCGVCGHDCLGGGCEMGRCRAVQVAAGDTNSSPRSIAVNAVDIFWTNESTGNVSRVPIQGGNPVVIGFSQPFAYGLTVDTNTLYWSRRGTGSDGAIARVALGGGAPVDLVTGLANPEDMANDDTHIYWGGFSTGIRRRAKTGGPIEVIAELSARPSRIALHDNFIFFTQYQSGALMRVGKDNTGILELYNDAGGSLGVAADASGAYWVNFLSGEVRAHTVGDTDLLLATAVSPRDIVVDQTFAYYTASGDNAVMRVLKDGSAPAEVFAGGQNAPRGITQDAVAVYWVNIDGTVWKRAKDP